MGWYLFWKLVHFVGIVGFAAGHGVSAMVTVRLRRERDRARLQALLDLSRSTLLVSNLSLALIVVSGVANWVVTDHAKQGWLWASVAVLVVLAAAGAGLAAPAFRRIRVALADGDEERLQTALGAPLWGVFWLETVGTLVILWLMVYKPF